MRRIPRTVGVLLHYNSKDITVSSVNWVRRQRSLALLFYLLLIFVVNKFMNLYSEQHAQRMKNIFTKNLDYGDNVRYSFCLSEDPTAIIETAQETQLEDIINELNPSSVLDYGCGFGYTVDYLKSVFPNIKFECFDPFVPKHAQRPTGTFDLVVAHNVLRIVEDQFLDSVIDDIYNYANHDILLQIRMYEKESRTWEFWQEKLSKFDIKSKGLGQSYPCTGAELEKTHIADSGFWIKK